MTDTSSGEEEGDIIFNTPGSYTWTAPQGVTAVAAIAIGGGGGGSGGAQDGGEQRLSGVVVVRLTTADWSGTQSGASAAVSGDYTILTFNGSGSFVV